jgi:Zn-dependent protease with chaperone function
MDFFAQQDHARKQTRLLVLLMILAVIAIVALVNVIAALSWRWLQNGFSHVSYPNGFFLTNTLVTAGLIIGGTLVELFNLREGGDAVARMAGGRLLSSATYDAKERQLQNVAAEMALASGIACPKIYVLDKEESINAFAAGYNPNEAVIAVTRGTLERLNRDELQGVIAHEFSHVLNGDMRLNVRLIGVLFGLHMISGFGQHLIDAAINSSGLRNGKQNFSLRVFLVIMGVALYITGYVGVVLGRIIKAAVSRQREFLADASAVQFTRNRDGIGGALRKIGGLSRETGLGSRIHHPNAEQLSHLFIGSPLPRLVNGWFATHPPISERLRRLYGRSVELLDAPVLQEAAAEPTRLPDIPFQAGSFGAWKEAGAHPPPVARDMPDKPLLNAGMLLPPEIDSALHDPTAVAAVVLALLVQRSRNTGRQQLLEACLPEQAAVVMHMATLLADVPATAHLSVLDLAMPALRQLPPPQRSMLLKAVEDVINHDGQVSWHEFVLQTILVRRLGPQAGRAVPFRFATAAQIRKECTLLLSLVARVSFTGLPVPSELEVQRKFMQAAIHLPGFELSPADLHAASAITLTGIRRALEQANCLMPLAKPALVKALCKICETEGEFPPVCVDTLRAICSAIDAPLPPTIPVFSIVDSERPRMEFA